MKTYLKLFALSLLLFGGCLPQKESRVSAPSSRSQVMASFIYEASEVVMNMGKVVKDDYASAIIAIHVERLKSKTLRDMVIQAFERNSGAMEKLFEAYGRVDASVGEIVNKAYSVSAATGAPLIHVIGRLESREASALIVNMVMDTYLRMLHERRDSTYDSAISFLEDQAEEMMAAVGEVERKMEYFNRENNMFVRRMKKETFVAEVMEIKKAIAKAKVERRFLEKGLIVDSNGVMESGERSKTIQKLKELEEILAQDIVTLTQEVQEVEGLLAEYGVFEKNKAIYQKKYGQLINRVTEAKITSQLKKRNLRLHEKALP